MMRVVLDTNVLIASFSKSSPFHEIWHNLREGNYTLCVSNDILMEYQEIIGYKTTPQIAQNVVDYLVYSRNVVRITPSYHFGLIKEDCDDNKFVDCAIAGNAAFIVSDDRHFRVLSQIEYPKVSVLKIMDFVRVLRQMRNA